MKLIFGKQDIKHNEVRVTSLNIQQTMIIISYQHKIFSTLFLFLKNKYFTTIIFLSENFALNIFKL